MAILLPLIFVSSCGKKEVEPVIEPLSEDNRLIVYTSHKEEVYSPIIKEFEERYGIWVETKTGGTTELLENIRESYGDFTCDVIFGGGAESYNAYSEYFIPYEVSEKSNIKSYDLSESNFYTPFSELPVVIVYNRKLINREAIPTGWNSLFDERYKGNIAFADPWNSGSSYTIISTILQALPGNDGEVLKNFVNQLDGKILSSSGEVSTAVSEGKFLIGLTLEETALKAIKSGGDIKVVYPCEGTSAVADAAAIVKGALHEDNAKLFLEFITSKDVQLEATEKMSRRSVRYDVSNFVSSEDFISLPYSINTATSEREFVFNIWNELTGKEVAGEE